MIPGLENLARSQEHDHSGRHPGWRSTVDQITAIAANLFDASVALVLLHQDGGLRVAGSYGSTWPEAALESGLAALALRTDLPIQVEDTQADTGLRDDLLMELRPQVRFYASAPLFSGNRSTPAFGTLCVLDLRPHSADARALENLRRLADLAAGEIERGRLQRAQQEASERRAAALTALARVSLLDQPDARPNLPDISKTVAQTLDVARVSFWRMRPDQGGIDCQHLYDAGIQSYSALGQLTSTSCPAYFSALRSNQPIVADDAQSDPRTRELAESYLIPLGISSMLDLPIFISGTLAGVLCLEHVGPMRRWTHGEQIFAVGVTALVTIMIAQRGRARSQARLRTFLDNTPECIRIVSPDGRLLDINPAGLSMVEASSLDQLSALPMDSFIHEDDRQDFRAAHARVAAGSPSMITFRIIGLQGTERWVQANMTPLRQADGTIESVLSVARDITGQMQVQQALRERIKELDCLYRVLELTTGNQRPAPAIIAEIANLLPGSLLHPDAAVCRITLGKEEYRDGRWQAPVTLLSRPILINGRETGSVEVGYLKTLPHQPGGTGPFLAEESALIEGVATHLGRMVAERQTSDLLRQSERLRAIGELTGGIAHDFNNLLQIILGTTDLLVSELAANRSLQELAEMSRSAAFRGADLTRRLLAFARQQPLDPTPTDIGRLVHEMQHLLYRTLGDHIAIRIRTESELWSAMIDASQLENAVLNLCINARDAMADGGTLTIELTNTTLDADYTAPQAELLPGDYVLIAISDTGSGMSREVLARAFDPFFTTKATDKGSGLGLSMVYGFAKQSRGNVRIYSEVGLGTTVKLYLPRSAQTAPERPENDQLPEASITMGGRERILLVEDEDLVREYVVGLLDTAGYQVTAARNGAAALEILEQSPEFDLLLTDVIMPGGIDGRQLAEHARRLKPGIPVLFTSGYAENAILHDGRLEPGVMLLSKPFRRQDLLGRISQALGRHVETSQGAAGA